MLGGMEFLRTDCFIRVYSTVFEYQYKKILYCYHNINVYKINEKLKI